MSTPADWTRNCWQDRHEYGKNDMTLRNPTCGNASNLYVELQEALPRAAAFSTGRTRARAKILKRNSEDDLVCTDDEVTVVNRYQVSFAKCDRILAMKTRKGEIHALPKEAPPDDAGDAASGEDCGAAGFATWRVVLENNRPAWELVESNCCHEGGTSGSPCACEASTTTTADPTTTTTTTDEGTTTTPECCAYGPVEPDMGITVEDVGKVVAVCCKPATECQGEATWNYSAATGEWTLDVEDCGEGCHPERPTLCPSEDSCTKTRCLPDQCGTTTTGEPCPAGGTTTTFEPTTTTGGGGTTTTGESTTTTCDPDCYNSGGESFPLPDCEPDCSYVCTRGGWVQTGNNSCGDFYIGIEGCPTNPRRRVTRVCSGPPTSPCNFDECGQQVAGGVIIDSPPPPPSPCSGSCRWSNFGFGWVRIGFSTCHGGIDCGSTSICGCVPPAPITLGPCDPPVHQTTPCDCLGGYDPAMSNCEVTTTTGEQDGGGGNCCNGDPTTTTAEECHGECSFKWSAAESSWGINKSTCSGTDCNCVGRPGFDGACDGQIQGGFCSDEVVDPTTTTTAEPTSTTGGSTTTDEPTTTTDDSTTTIEPTTTTGEPTTTAEPACCDGLGPSFSLVLNGRCANGAAWGTTIGMTETGPDSGVWTGSDTLSCGDTINATFTCLDSVATSCQDAYDLDINMPCASPSDVSVMITDCACDPPSFTFTWSSNDLSECNCCVECFDDGPCEWLWSDDTGSWILLTGICDGSCPCATPEGTGTDQQIVYTECGSAPFP